MSSHRILISSDIRILFVFALVSGFSLHQRFRFRTLLLSSAANKTRAQNIVLGEVLLHRGELFQVLLSSADEFRDVCVESVAPSGLK